MTRVSTKMNRNKIRKTTVEFNLTQNLTFLLPHEIDVRGYKKVQKSLPKAAMRRNGTIDGFCFFY